MVYISKRNILEICIPFKHEVFWISPFNWNNSYCITRRVVHCSFFHWWKLFYMSGITQTCCEHICAVRILRTVWLDQTSTCILFFQQWQMLTRDTDNTLLWGLKEVSSTPFHVPWKSCYLPYLQLPSGHWVTFSHLYFSQDLFSLGVSESGIERSSSP